MSITCSLGDEPGPALRRIAFLAAQAAQAALTGSGKSMEVAVTGGGGFIGSHVVDHLVLAGHQVHVIDPAPRWRNPAARYSELDLFDAGGLAGALAGCAAVFHLAGASDVNDVATDPVAAVRLNVEGTARVLEAARQQRCD